MSVLVVETCRNWWFTMFFFWGNCWIHLVFSCFLHVFWMLRWGPSKIIQSRISARPFSSGALSCGTQPWSCARTRSWSSRRWSRRGRDLGGLLGEVGRSWEKSLKWCSDVFSWFSSSLWRFRSFWVSFISWFWWKLKRARAGMDLVDILVPFSVW